VGALLSVVTPIYNVARYLPECLDSLADQTHPDIEFVLVDDGSTDDSGEIAAARAEADPRFQLIRQPNRGLGAARNTGIRAACGDYLAFVDSDDVLPRYAFELLVGALESTGSQIASGNVLLFNSRGLWQSPLHRGTHRRTRLGARLRRRRNLLYDRLACNKVFRRDFWTGNELWFPEGVRYEDIPVTVPAYALAAKIDVLSTPVYHWRQREAGAEESISQRQTEITNLVDRFAAVRSASRSLAALGNRRLKNHYDTIALRSDLRMFLYLLPDVADEAYRQRFLQLAGEFLAEVDPSVPDRLEPGLRVAWRLAGDGRLAELLTVVAATRLGQKPPVVPDVPVQLYRPDRRLRTALRSVAWRGGRLRISGHVYRAPQVAGAPWLRLRALWLRERGRSGRRVPGPAHSRVFAGRGSASCQSADDPPAGSGFDASFRTSALRPSSGWRTGTWLVMTGVVDPAGPPVSGPVKVGEIQPALPATWVAPGVRIVPVVYDGALRLRVERPRVWATAAEVDDDSLVISGTVAAGVAPPTALSLSRTPAVVWRRYPTAVGGSARPAADPAAAGPDTDEATGAVFSCRIPLADLLAGAAVQRPAPVGDPVSGWLVGYRLGADRTDEHLPVGEGFVDLHPVGGRPGPLVEPGDHGSLTIRMLPTGPMVTWATVDQSGVTIGGECAVDDLPSLVVLRHADDLRDAAAPADRDLPVESVDEGRQVRVPAAGPDQLEPGRWWFGYRPGAGDQVCDLPVSLGIRDGLGRADGTGGRQPLRLRLEPDRLHRVALLAS